MREHPAPLVLVCDDHGEDREMYATYFLAKGFRVPTAGEAAFRYAVESRPDAIVMDLSMPRVDGWEATRRLKADARTRDIPGLYRPRLRRLSRAGPGGGL